MKKIISTVLCIAMVLALGTVAFADDSDLDIILFTPAVSGGADNVLAQYKDVKAGEWYVDGLAYCVEHGLMKGTGDDTISPKKTITRAEIITMIYRMAGEPAFMNDNTFSDVPAGSYYEKAVVWASGNEIVNGTGNSKFSPNVEITRESLITMLFKYGMYNAEQNGENVNLFSPDLALTFADSNKISSWATSAFRWAAAENIISGKDGNMADPSGTATRAEAAVMFQRFGGEGKLPKTPDTPTPVVVGGWNPYVENAELDMTKIPDLAKDAFEKATGNVVGASYKPIVYLGSQVVAGANYRFLCEVAPVIPNAKASIKEVVIYRRFDGTAEMTSVKDVSLDYADQEGSIVFPTTGLAGAFSYNDALGGAVDSKIAEAFKKATTGLLGVKYEPLAVVAQQLVAGTNYAIVVKATPTMPDSESAVGIVKLYAGLDGTCQMTIWGNL